jgi:hypothetical protein
VTYELVADVPESREITLRLPPDVPVGKVRVSVSTPEPQPIPVELGEDRRPRVFPTRPTHPKLAAEHDAFQKMLPELLTTHRGVYVAVHDGHVVATGKNPTVALNDAAKLFPGQFILVRLVTDQPQPIERLTRYREVRNG